MKKISSKSQSVRESLINRLEANIIFRLSSKKKRDPIHLRNFRWSAKKSETKGEDARGENEGEEEEEEIRIRSVKSSSDGFEGLLIATWICTMNPMRNRSVDPPLGLRSLSDLRNL